MRHRIETFLTKPRILMAAALFCATTYAGVGSLIASLLP